MEWCSKIVTDAYIVVGTDVCAENIFEIVTVIIIQLNIHFTESFRSTEMVGPSPTFVHGQISSPCMPWLRVGIL